MYTLITIIVLIAVAFLLRVIYVLFKDKINFFITGFDSGFAFADLILLWKVATICELKEPTSLFYSLSSLTKCMSQVTAQSTAEGSEQSPKTQKLLSKLFDYRTKLQNKSDDKKGLSNTQALEKGQTLRIIFPGQGVFTSKILNNASSIAISVPKQKGIIEVPAENWVGRVISVYFWRKGDARYVFDTTVLKNGLFSGEAALFLKHTSNLLRTQKRKSVRVKCQIPCNLFIVNKPSVDYTAVETRNGYKCILEDVSESGALIKIGGKGAQDIKIKIQYSINNKLIVMFGIVRTVQYNEEKNQSLLHFECTHIEPMMRNEILSFVYNTMPDNEKEVLEALEQTELDYEEDPTAPKEEKSDNGGNKAKSETNDQVAQVKEANTVASEVIESTVNSLTPGLGKQQELEDFSADDIEELDEVIDE